MGHLELIGSAEPILNIGQCEGQHTNADRLQGANSSLLEAVMLRSGGLKVRLAQVDCVGEFEGKGDGRVFGNDQR